MPNKEQNTTATKNNMAAQQKEKKKKYTSVENSDGTTTNTFEKKRKLGKGKGKVKTRVTSKVKKNKSGETRGLASVTQKYDKKGELKKEKGSGKYTELASLRESVKKNDGIAASQQRGSISLQKAKVNASKNKKSKPTTSKSGKKVGDVFSIIENKSSFSPKLAETPKAPKIAPMPKEDAYAYNKIAAGQMKNKAKTSDEMALAPSRQVMRNRENINFDSSTDRGIKSLYTGKRQEEYTDSGMNYRDANSNVVKGSQVDEGEISSVVRKSPERPYVVGGKDSMYANEKLYLDKAAKMVAPHPSQQRMGNMVNKVATYNMPNTKAAQKKYHK